MLAWQKKINFLKEFIIASRSRHKSFIPFERLLSELLYNGGIVSFIRSVGSEDVLESVSCEIFKA